MILFLFIEIKTANKLLLALKTAVYLYLDFHDEKIKSIFRGRMGLLCEADKQTRTFLKS